MVIQRLAGAITILGLMSATANAQTYVRQVEPTPDQLNQNVRAQFIRAGDVSPEEYSRLLAEAEKVRAYQGSVYTHDDGTFSYLNETPVPYVSQATTVYDGQPNYVSEASTVYTGPVYSSTSSGGYQIELYDSPIPAATTTPAASTTYDASYSTIAASHTVSRGDTLYGISKRYGVSLSDLKSSNGLSGNTISIGQVLNMPGQRRSVTQPYTISQSPTLIRNVEPIPFSGIYAVLPGDTLYSIARRACVSVDEISSENSLYSTNINPGQRLTMPSGHCLQ